MPNAKKRRPRMIPGEKDQFLFSELIVRLDLGDLGIIDTLDMMVYIGMIDQDADGQPTQPYGFTLAIRPNGTKRDHRSLIVVNDWADDEGSYEDSERKAKHLARSWHLEHYTFSHYEKTGGRFSKQIAVYTLDGARAIQPQPNGSRWKLVAGPRIAVPASGSAVLPSQDEWDTACNQIEAACESFHKLAALCFEPGFEGYFDGTRSGVETARSEARRLALMGQQLSAVDEPTEGISAVLDETRDRLSELRIEVLAAVEMLAQSQLKMPDAFGSAALETTDGELAARAGVVDELTQAKV